MDAAEREDHMKHKHFICQGCGMGYCTAHEKFEAMQEGDGCPDCHIATVTEVQLIGPLPVPPDMAPYVQMVMDFVKKNDEQMERQLKLREQTRDALRSIANSLELLTGCISGDDQGRATLRISGEIIGGEGDVTAEVR